MGYLSSPARATSRSEGDLARALHTKRTGTALPPVQPSPGLLEYPVVETLSPKHALAYTQRRDRSSNNLRLGTSVQPKFHFQSCIQDSEPHMPSPFIQRNLVILTPKNESTKWSFPFLPAIVYCSAYAPNCSLALKPTVMQRPTFILLSSRAGWPCPSCHGDQSRAPANSQAICSHWLGTDNLTAQWSYGA